MTDAPLLPNEQERDERSLQDHVRQLVANAMRPVDTQSEIVKGITVILEEHINRARIEENLIHDTGLKIASKREKDSLLYDALHPVFMKRIAELKAHKEKTE